MHAFALSALVAAFTVFTAIPAWAQRTPVTTRPSTTTTRPTTTTTGKSVDDLAERAGVLQSADLPSGYVLDDVRTETGSSPYYPTVDGDCEVQQTRFSGAPPALASASFENGRTRGSGNEGIFAFSSTKTAQDYYRKHAAAFRDLTGCGKTIAPNGATGTYRSFQLGKIGNERTGLAFDPTGSQYFPTRFALARSGSTVLYLDLNDNAATDASFASLAKVAEQRAR
jgi:hypothetical protein